MTGTGTSWAWQSWTPTWTNLTIGNGTNTANYIQIGKTVFFEIKTVFGSTTSITGSPPSFTLPVTASSSYTDEEAFCYGTLRDVTGFGYTGMLCFNGTTKGQLYTGTAAFAFVSSSSPHTWAVSDYIYFNGSYRAA